MYCVYLLLTFYFSSLQSIPPLLQAFFELLPALITHHSAIYKHQSSQKHLLKVMCQPVHPCRNPTPTLKPSISLAALIHVLHHPQIPLPLLTSTCSTTIPLLAPCHMLSLHTNTQTEQLFLTFIFLHPHSQYTLGTKLYSCLLIITSLLNLASVTLFHIMALPFYHLVVLTVLHNCSWQLVPVHFFSISQASLNPLPYLIDFSISPQECHQDQPYFHPSALHSSPDFSVFFLLLKGLHLTILRALRQLLWIDFIYSK